MMPVAPSPTAPTQPGARSGFSPLTPMAWSQIPLLPVRQAAHGSEPSLFRDGYARSRLMLKRQHPEKHQYWVPTWTACRMSSTQLSPTPTKRIYKNLIQHNFSSTVGRPWCQSPSISPWNLFGGSLRVPLILVRISPLPNPNLPRLACQVEWTWRLTCSRLRSWSSRGPPGNLLGCRRWKILVLGRRHLRRPE